MKHIIYTFLAVLSFCFSGYAQEAKGNVTDNNGMALPGVNVISETGKTAVTDFDGNFTINAAIGEKLEFSMIGYTKITMSASASMNVRLSEEATQLQEVVAIGYGTKRSGSITGSVVRIKSDDIVRTPAQSAVQAIQGKSAGVNIVTNDEPGANPSIRIRGLGTILGGRNPLYVIDGVEAASANGLNPNDIATIDVLKDASSLAIYGQKSSNGVIIITTKRGKTGEMKVEYSTYYGQKEALKKVKMADSYRFSYYANSALGTPEYFRSAQPYETDWFEEITRKGEVMNNSVSVSGATEKSNYYLGLSHYTEKGILLGTDFKKTNVLSKNEFKLFNDKLKINQFVNAEIIHNNPKPLSAFTNAYKQAPLVPVRYANGRWGASFLNKATGMVDLDGTDYDKFNTVANPVAQLYNTHEENKGVTFTASLLAELRLHTNLTYTSSFGSVSTWSRGYTYTPLREIALSIDPFATDESYEETFGDKTVLDNKLQQRRYEAFNWNWDNYLTYKKQFGNHDLTVVAGMSRTTNNNSETFNVFRYNVPEQKNYWSLDFATNNDPIVPFDSNNPDNSPIRNYRETPRIAIAYFGRVEYEFKNKYLFTATVRREGISVFQADKKWAIFPSFSAGWVVTNEEFMKSVKFLDNLKLRAGYGELGSGDGPVYNNIAFSPNKNYPFGTGTINPGAYVANAVDPNLTWQTTKEIDLGIDFATLNGRLTGTFDYYNRKTDDIILPVSPPFVISEEDAYLNAGEITNKGYEVSLRWDDRVNENLSYAISGNFSNNKNEVSSIDTPYFKNFAGSGDLGNGEYTKLIKLGQPLGSFYVFEQIGYDSGGVPIYNDMVDGIAGLTDNDRINAGSYIPDYTYALNFSINYRNFDFSVDTYGVGGSKIYNGKKAQRMGGENVEYEILDDFWTPSTPNAENPKPFNERPRPSTYYVENGDYFRINNITLGYTLPKMIDKIDKVRIYLTAVNPFLFTDYSGYSPELVGNDDANPIRTAGIELDAYPTNRTFLVGANVKF